MDMLSAELRMDIRKELRAARDAGATRDTWEHVGSARGNPLSVFAGAVLMALVVVLGLVLVSAFDLTDWQPEWRPET